MRSICLQLWNDEAGFIVSAELILVATIGVLSMVVGLTEVSSAINQELEDVASAFGSINQSFRYQGLCDSSKAQSSGSSFDDHVDDCDSEYDIGLNGSKSEQGDS